MRHDVVNVSLHFSPMIFGALWYSASIAHLPLEGSCSSRMSSLIWVCERNALPGLRLFSSTPSCNSSRSMRMSCLAHATASFSACAQNDFDLVPHDVHLPVGFPTYLLMTMGQKIANTCRPSVYDVFLSNRCILYLLYRTSSEQRNNV